MQPTNEVEIDIDLSDIESIADMPSVLPERVITEENAKTFEVRADLFVLDGDNQSSRKIDYWGCLVEYINPIPVINDAGSIIGASTLFKEGNVLVGQFFLDYSTPERLNIETRSMPMYPHLHSQTKVLIKNGSIKAEKMVITKVVLGLEKNIDDRIKAL